MVLQRACIGGAGEPATEDGEDLVLLELQALGLRGGGVGLVEVCVVPDEAAAGHPARLVDRVEDGREVGLFLGNGRYAEGAVEARRSRPDVGKDDADLERGERARAALRAGASRAARLRAGRRATR